MKTTVQMIQQGLKPLEKTAGGRSSGPAGAPKYIPPEAVRNAARLGILLRMYNETERGLKRPGGTDIGVARAVQLSSAKKIPPRSIKRMVAYFTRHQGDKRHKDFGNEDNPSPGYVAWLLWGGDPGYEWAKKIVREEDL